MTKIIKGKNHKERSDYQLNQWVDGNSICNKADDECCPDFSCCKPELLVGKEQREIFRIAIINNDEETKMSMLWGFLGSALANEQPEKEIYVTGG
jgi:hypothetical protein